ncbi:RNA-splicing ligase RtcB [Pedobacter yulinensis]|uniref:3'-phosphate/5'-hydroxy nucleic acid ligase n=1 Tax=Pedobacter yulinensis TaxID=2126353 RepID=A0A2T3HJC0_9SPHI|nr:RtcB family protein [Pedobacter yulinensis]PST82532.1 RNA-splicing ligase RtcB [Pedobacter yulinensis]
MEREKISNSELTALGFAPLKLLVSSSRVANGLLKEQIMGKREIISHLGNLLSNPEPYLHDRAGKFRNLAREVVKLRKNGKLPAAANQQHTLKNDPLPYRIFGAEGIEAGALAQMNTAMQLPVSVAGALMPDAHQGYGLPIGGVLATRADAIIPYAVGVDIACRMCMSIFELPGEASDTRAEELRKLLLQHTNFGMGGETAAYFDTSLFDRPEWQETKQIRALKDKAYRQLGTSGTGNHFVEWGELELKPGAFPDLPGGNYLALLSHSGSRGFGGSLAAYYSDLAMKKTDLPKEARHLAWLDLQTEEGQEYWIAMNLAGDYASANHHEIHNKIARALHAAPLLRIENHHNFAWKESLADGTKAMVHRKGATPAGAGVLGIIPGSMTAPGFLVRGKGEVSSLQSAAHGAGRTMSRSAAFKTLDRQAVKAELARHKVTLIGSDLDEAPMAYKDIYRIMEAQTELVDVLAIFRPRIVRMANPKERPED